MPEIVLSSLNAKYIHAAFGLRCLAANLGPLRPQASIVEFDIHQPATGISRAILDLNPTILGLGVYIWNVAQTTEVVRKIKQQRPDLRVVLGGPEVSFEFDRQEIVLLADHLITGEADLEFARLCRAILDGSPPAEKILHAPLPALDSLTLPYQEYSDDDIAHRILYVEASRGCPFTCEFCLSSLDVPVRQFPLAPFLDAIQRLIDRGARQFKFVDRTFNLNLHTTRAILEFFLERLHLGIFLHFELIPDRLPDSLRQILVRFPPGTLQFEIGIQTFDESTSNNISRRQNPGRIEDNLRFLRASTGVHVHADLIAGLPGESFESFAAGFNRLLALNPQEIQVGILKRLRGTPIVRHDRAHRMVYSPTPPYEIIETRLIDAATMERLRGFARFWDLIANSGNFVRTSPLLWERAESPFHAFMKFADWLHNRAGRSHGIPLHELMEHLLVYLTAILHLPAQRAAQSLWDDYHRAGRTDVPRFLREHLPHLPRRLPAIHAAPSATPARQARHLSGVTSQHSTFEP